jgi:phosphatidate cytidylyltransferase
VTTAPRPTSTTTSTSLRSSSADDFFPDDDLEPEPRKPEPQAQVTPIRTRGASGARSTGTTAAVGTRAAGARRRAPGQPEGEAGFTQTRGTGGRDMPFAIAVGVGLAAVAVALFWLGGAATMVLVVAVLFLAAMEFYEKLREKGYQPATLVGLVAVVGLPLAAYWKGEEAIPLVVFLGMLATCLWFLLSGSADSSPLPNVAVTTLGIALVGVMGSFAAVQLKAPDGVSLLLLTAIGVVAYDVGGLFVGSAAGRTQLVPWVSPNKTVEGLVGGILAVFLALLVAKLIGIQEVFDESLARMLLLALVIAVTAPIGDLTLSMLKRNLGVKDWGTLLPGHGGILDRFCSFLFALPAVWYLYRVLVA